jgi:hypothetical protein
MDDLPAAAFPAVDVRDAVSLRGQLIQRHVIAREIFMSKG